MLFNTISFATIKRQLKISASVLSAFTALMIAQSATATIVQFQTVMGDFQVNLYDKATPKTVENFLTYVKSGAYTNTIIHRAIPGFVVQGGGYKYDNKFPLIDVAQNAAVINEPVYSNKRGTIGMAKNADVNSATNQWFFNVADNSTALDGQAGGLFTVFGEVVGNGMTVIDAMTALNIFNFGSNTAFANLPLRNYTAADGSNNVAITDKNLVLILGVVILDANIDTAANLSPTLSTANSSSSSNSNSSSSATNSNSNSSAPVNNSNSTSSGGGGSIGLLELLLLVGLIGFRRK